MDTNENNGSGRASYSEEERRELIVEFGASGLSQAAFCREWNINPKTFARWMRNEREGEAKASFLEVEVGSRPVPSGEVRVCLPNRIEVLVPVGSPKELGAVLREAAGCLG
jgi:transposase-like protein